MTGSIVLFGAGGHAKVAIDVLRRAGEDVVACLVPDASPGGTVDGVPILDEARDAGALRAAGFVRALVALGDNRARRRVADEARAAGFELVSGISPHSVVAPDVLLGSGVLIVHGAIINAAAQIGDDVIVNTGATIDHDAVIGAGAHVAPGCHLAGNVTIGPSVLLGVGTVVIPGITIGEGAIVGAGSVVVRDIESNASCWGNPARVQNHNGGIHQ